MLKILMVDSLVGNDYSTCLCGSLQKNGVDVRMIVPENREFLGKEKFEIVYLSPSKDKDQGKIKKVYGFIKYLFLLYNYIKRFQCDLVHYQFFRRNSEMLFFKFLKLRGVKLILTAHNVVPHERASSDYFLKSLVYKNADAIIVHSNYIQEKLSRTFSIEKNKINIIPHGNFDIYLPEKEISVPDARSKFEFSLDDNVLLYFGFIRPYKGLDILLNAFEIAAERDPKLKLLIAGSVEGGVMKESLIQSISKSNFNNRIVHKIEYIANEEIVNYFKASDIVVLPYKNIDHSGIIHLAYSFGRPVITTNVGDFGEVVEEGKSGFILNTNTVDELADTISRIFKKDKIRLLEMGSYAKELSITKYSWDSIAKTTKKLYSSI